MVILRHLHFAEGFQFKLTHCKSVDSPLYICRTSVVEGEKSAKKISSSAPTKDRTTDLLDSLYNLGVVSSIPSRGAQQIFLHLLQWCLVPG